MNSLYLPLALWMVWTIMYYFHLSSVIQSSYCIPEFRSLFRPVNANAWQEV